MKQGILIQAHKDFDQLYHLVEYFRTDCYVFIHLDKKAAFTQEQVNLLQKMEQVKGVFRKYSVHWAGFSILKCELFLLMEAMKFPEVGYFHLISAQDYPIKPLEDFLNFFLEPSKEYLNYAHIPNPGMESNTFQRFKYYYLFDYLDRTDKAKKFIWKSVKFQQKLGIRRTIPQQFEHIYTGSAWFSITRKGASTLLEHTKKHPAFYNRLKFTFCPEETYVTTVLVNLMEKKRIENCNYRFIRWNKENGSNPSNLGREHFHYLHECRDFFARKFDKVNNKEITCLIDKYLLQDSPLETVAKGGWIYNGFLRYPFDNDVMSALYDCYIHSKSTTVLDCGCGAGNYVAALRRLKVNAVGFDSNPYTPSLSTILLPEGDSPCEQLDITDDFDDDDKFDMVICLDVLHCIPEKLRGKAIANLCKLTSKVLVIKTSSINKDIVIGEIMSHGMWVNDMMSHLIQKKNSGLWVFQKH